MKITTVAARTAASGTHIFAPYRGIASQAAIAATTASRMILPSSPRVLPAARPQPGLVATVSVKGLLLRTPIGLGGTSWPCRSVSAPPIPGRNVSTMGSGGGPRREPPPGIRALLLGDPVADRLGRRFEGCLRIGASH